MKNHKFQKGDFVQVDLVRPTRLRPNGFYGIVCKISKRPGGECMLVHTQAGSKHWYWDDELIKATDDGTTI
jgi:hypothetical protein